MRYGKIKKTAFFLLLIYILSIYIGAIPVYALEGVDVGERVNLSEDIRISSRIYELFGGGEKSAPETLAVGGGIFGLKIDEVGASVKTVSDKSPFKVGDRIVAINGNRISSPEEVEAAVKSSGGETIEFETVREGEIIKIRIKPSLMNGEYKIGISLRDGVTGIGTVSFIDPETGLFGGLGHGVCDNHGELIPLESGKSCDVILGGVKRGEAGKPGELCGSLTKRDTGTILKNSECGIFGILSIIPDDIELLPIAARGEIHEGAAEIISTVKGGRTARYKVELYDIDYSSEESKSFKIKVTDEILKSITGGIVKGMSGSTVIQDGKIVGALTHVMVSDPEMGYGIFIENMLAKMKAR